MTTREAAARRGTTVRAIRALIDRGVLVATRHGRDWWISETQLAAVADIYPGWRRRKVKA